MIDEPIVQLLFASWVLFAIVGTFGDALVGFIDEWLLEKLKHDELGEIIDAPGKLLLISGFFGIITAVVVSVVVIVNPNMVFNHSMSGLILGITAGFVEVLWLIPYFNAINRSGALDATPILQSIPIFAGLIGVLLFNEIPSAGTIGGSALIIIGAVILNYSPTTKRIDRRTILLMLFASALAALGLFIFKAAAVASTTSFAIVSNGLGMFVASLGVWLIWKPYRQQFNQFIQHASARIFMIQASNEALYTASAMAGQVAVVLGPSVMAVSAISALHPFFTFVIAGILAVIGSTAYKERLSGSSIFNKFIAVILIVCGTLILLNS